MKKRITRVIFIILCVLSTCFALLSAFMGKLIVAETTILPIGASLVIGLLPIILIVHIIGLLIVLLILGKQLPVRVFAIVVVSCSLVFSLVLPNMRSFCLHNYQSNLKYRQEFIDNYFLGSESPVEYNPGKYIVNSSSLSSSKSVTIGRIGKSTVFVFRVNYGFFPRYVMYISNDCDPEGRIMTDIPGYTLSGYHIISQLSDNWFLVR